jgi:hypothetical protein
MSSNSSNNNNANANANANANTKQQKKQQAPQMPTPKQKTASSYAQPRRPERHDVTFGIREIVLRERQPAGPSILTPFGADGGADNCYMPMQQMPMQMQVQQQQQMSTQMQMPMQPPKQQQPQPAASATEAAAAVPATTSDTSLNLQVTIVSTTTATTTTAAATTTASASGGGGGGKAAEADADAAAKQKTAAAAPAEEEDVVVGVIFTVAQSQSYDELFQRVKQDAPDGECVKVYEVEAAFVPFLHRALESSKVAAASATEPQREEAAEAAPAPVPAPAAAALSASAVAEMAAAIVAELSPGAQRDAMARTLARVMAEVTELEADSVVVNFECCSNCSSETGFALPRTTTTSRCAATSNHKGGHCHNGTTTTTTRTPADADQTLEFIASAVSCGFLVMVSDFSLKALISAWDRHSAATATATVTPHPVLGLNPFAQLGVFGSHFRLRFDAAELKDCCSAQLKMLSEISTEGTAESHALSGTILFGVDQAKARASAATYKLQVLTVMTECAGEDVSKLPRERVVSVAGHTGAAGHVALTFPSGGVLLAAAGHWVELQRVKTDERSFFNVMASEYGGAESGRSQQMQAEYAALPTAAARDGWLQSNAQRMVQSRSCAKYSAAKSKWSGNSSSSNNNNNNKGEQKQAAPKSS